MIGQLARMQTFIHSKLKSMATQNTPQQNDIANIWLEKGAFSFLGFSCSILLTGINIKYFNKLEGFFHVQDYEDRVL